MRTYYCDASTYNNGQVGQDSWCLVVTPSFEILKEHIGNRTINYAELWAIYMAAEHAEDYDLLITDSLLAYRWITKKVKQTKSNGHLLELINTIKQMKGQKNLSLQWLPRERNIAGQVIEESYRGRWSS